MVTSAEAFEGLAHARIEADVPGVDLDVFRAFFGLSRVTSRLIADFESVVQRPRGLSWAGFRLLFCLWVGGPMQTGDLARLLFTTAPTVSSVVNTLEARRWVRRERLARDRRLVEVRLTPSGGRLIRSVFRVQHEREVAWAAGLSADDLTAFVRVVEHVATRARPDETAGRRPATPAVAADETAGAAEPRSPVGAAGAVEPTDAVAGTDAAGAAGAAERAGTSGAAGAAEAVESG
jgi:DNA-binding MarR family transcriptional regulator